MRTFIRRHVIATAIVVVALAGAVGVAVAQVGGGDSAASPESGTRGEGVPEGPYVDFCPTPEQTEEHLKLYGFDYKPTVACTREGEPAPPTDEQRADSADDPDAGLSGDELAARLKEELLNAEPAPNPDGDPSTIDYITDDGRRAQIEVFGSVPGEGEMTPAEFARTLP